MIKKITLALLFLFLGIKEVSAQKLVKSTSNSPSILPLEKVYIHTDRNFYNIGETLWYKAYLTSAYTTVLNSNSKILYVELVSPDSKIIARNNTFLNYGLGNGDMVLSDSIGVKPGTYQLRAYTNYMRNFDTDFVFSKEIEIMDIAEIKGAEKEISTPIKKSKSKDVVEVEPDTNLLVQFFPESGSLIEGVACNVAFNVTNKIGLPIETSGALFDSEGSEITKVVTEHNGMGKFIFTPNELTTYFVEMKGLNDETFKVELPAALKTGFAITVSNLNGKNIVTIKTNEETLEKNLNKQLPIYFSTRGVNYFEGGIVLKKTNTSILLPEDKLPSGIVQITLLDTALKPQAERLFYVEKESSVQFKLTSDKVEYNSKEKVNLHVSSKNNSGTPLAGSYSIAVIDTKAIPFNKNSNATISSYFLMESDIKGAVYNPGYYFNSENVDRLKHLDLLLLTQGWRDFIWKKSYAKNELKYQTEKGIEISGTVKRLFSSGIKDDSKVNLFYINKGKAVFEMDTTDSEGRFKFKNLNMVGTTEIRLNARNKNNKNSGMFVLDSIYNDPMTVNFKGVKSFDESKLSAIQRVKESIQQKFLEYNVPLSNRLKEVLIVGKTKDENENKYGFSDYTYDGTKEESKFSTTYDLIQFTVPGIFIFNDSISFRRNNGASALILVDDMEVSSSDVRSIPPSTVARMEALNSVNASSFGPKGANGVILIYTKSGGGVTKEVQLFHTVTKKMEGYYNAKVFYSPNYDKPPVDDWEKKRDVRNTLYWNPYVHPDATGNAEISFFNSEVATKVSVQLEGLTAEGIPVVENTSYEIIE